MSADVKPAAAQADERRPRVGKAGAAATPPAFRDALLALARGCRRSEAA